MTLSVMNVNGESSSRCIETSEPSTILSRADDLPSSPDRSWSLRVVGKAQGNICRTK